MSLLSICQDVAAEVHIASPAAIIGSTNRDARKLLRLAQKSGKELARYHDWQSLTVEYTFSALAQQAQTGKMPSDFARFVYNARIWNRSRNQQIIGPTPHHIWSQLLGTGITGGAAGWWRLIGGELHIIPNPTAGDTIAFDYVSRNWCESSGGTGQNEWKDDTDVCRIVATTGETIGEDLIALDMIWRWRHSIGLATYAEDMLTASMEKEKAAGRDRGTGRIRPENPHADWPQPPFYSGGPVS